jgi:hypothetical protein
MQESEVPVSYEPTTSWTVRSGAIASSQDWGSNARIHVTGTVSVAAGATVTIGAGTVVRCAPGVEFWVRPGGEVRINGTVSAPVVFAPAAIQISKVYGIDPFQMGLVMVMCNQIGAVSPPTAPLLFVTTSIAQTTYAEVNRHVWWFMLAEVLVLLLVIFIPGLASWIPRYFLG